MAVLVLHQGIGEDPLLQEIQHSINSGFSESKSKVCIETFNLDNILVKECAGSRCQDKERGRYSGMSCKKYKECIETPNYRAGEELLAQIGKASAILIFLKDRHKWRLIMETVKEVEQVWRKTEPGKSVRWQLRDKKVLLITAYEEKEDPLYRMRFEEMSLEQSIRRMGFLLVDSFSISSENKLYMKYLLPHAVREFIELNKYCYKRYKSYSHL